MIVFEGSRQDLMEKNLTGPKSKLGKAFENVFLTFRSAHWSKSQTFHFRERGFPPNGFLQGPKLDGIKLKLKDVIFFTF